MLVACLCLLTAAVPRTGNAHDAQVTKLMAALKITQPNWVLRRLKAGTQSAGKDAPALYFGLTKMNNNVAVVDEVVKAGGKGAAATLFVKDGDEFVRVATTVMKRDKTGRAVGTALDPGPALDALKTGKASTAPMTTRFSA